MVEGLIGYSVCRGVRCCWARRRSCDGYQRLPRAAPPGRGTRLGRRTVFLGSTACSRRLARLRRRCASAPLQLLNRILHTYITSMLSQAPLNKIPRAGVPPAPADGLSSPPKLRRRDASSSSSSRRRDAAGGGGRGVMLNICVAEVLLRRTTSEVSPSPLQPQPQQQPTKDARRTSVRRA